jgi:hypothetical protein
VAYSVPPEWVGQVVCCRVEVDSDLLAITAGATLLCRHRLQPGATEPVWDPAHRAAAEAIALGRTRPKLHVLPPPGPEPRAPRLELGAGDYDVEALDLAARYGGCGCTGRGA